MMTAEQLKNSILQLAMQGKLVEQRPEEGTGEELFKKIQTEKIRLIKEGIIKNENKTDDISEEVSIEIPDTWVWAKLCKVSVIITGGTPSKSHPEYYGGDYPFYKPADIQEKKIVESFSEGLSEIGFKKARFIPKGSVAVNCIGNIGKSAILPEDGTTNQQINSICYYPFPDYMYWYCQSNLFLSQLSSKSSMTTIPIVNKTKMEEMIIPLPPLAEQKRIVAKIEELMPFVEQYAAASTKLNTLNTSFPEMMKKSILQEAVQGKLVPQDPNDEPASVLLKKIAEEKKRLIKEGKIKKQKPLPEIIEEEIPFEIPESWEWCRLIDCVIDVSDVDHKMPQAKINGIPYISPLDFTPTGINFESAKRISEEDYFKLSKKCKPEKNDIIFPRYGTIGVLRYINTDRRFLVSYSSCVIKTSKQQTYPKYLYYALQSPWIREEINRYVNKTTQPNVGMQSIKTFLFPLPPLAEQERIVARIEEIIPRANELKAMSV